jgi:hypothetical protein
MDDSLSSLMIRSKGREPRRSARFRLRGAFERPCADFTTKMNRAAALAALKNLHGLNEDVLAQCGSKMGAL